MLEGVHSLRSFLLPNGKIIRVSVKNSAGALVKKDQNWLRRLLKLALSSSVCRSDSAVGALQEVAHDTIESYGILNVGKVATLVQHHQLC